MNVFSSLFIEWSSFSGGCLSEETFKNMNVLAFRHSFLSGCISLKVVSSKNLLNVIVRIFDERLFLRRLS